MAMWMTAWLLLCSFASLVAGAAEAAGASCENCQTKGFYMLQRRNKVHKSDLQLKQAPCDLSPVEAHGFLKVVGNKVTDESGEPVQLRGMSLFWSQWKPQYWTKGTVEWLQKDWNISLIRAPMAVEAGGYLTNKEEAKKMKTVVEAAIDAGIYVAWRFAT